MPRSYQKTLREKATLYLSESPDVDLAWMLKQLQRDYNGPLGRRAKAARRCSVRCSKLT
jgi:hypothetical protein